MKIGNKKLMIGALILISIVFIGIGFSVLLESWQIGSEIEIHIGNNYIACMNTAKTEYIDTITFDSISSLSPSASSSFKLVPLNAGTTYYISFRTVDLDSRLTVTVTFDGTPLTTVETINSNDIAVVITVEGSGFDTQQAPSVETLNFDFYFDCEDS